MGYSAEDFFKDVVKVADELDDILKTENKNGLLKFIGRLCDALGGGDIAFGAYSALSYWGGTHIIYSDGFCERLVGELPIGYELVKRTRE